MIARGSLCFALALISGFALIAADDQPESSSAERPSPARPHAQGGEDRDRFQERLAAMRKQEDQLPAKDLADAMCELGQSRAGHEDPAKAQQGIDLLNEVARRFPNEPAGADALVWIGRHYELRHDGPKMVEAFQRVLQKKDIEISHSLGLGEWKYRTHGEANGQLAYYYFARCDWQKAQDHWAKYDPSEVGGSCGTAMIREHQLHLRRTTICKIHLSQFDRAAEAAWHNCGDDLMALALIRLYRDAGQMDDLKSLLAAYEEEAGRQADRKVDRQGEKNDPIESELKSRLAIIAKMREMMGWLQTKQASDGLAIPPAGSESRESPCFHVSAWLLASDPQLGIPLLIGNTDDTHRNKRQCQVLAAIETPAANQKLRELVQIWPDEVDKTAIEIIFQYRRDPQSLFDEIQLDPRETEGLGGDVYREVGYFYRSWPKPAKGSLTKQLPKGLFDPPPGTMLEPEEMDETE